MKPAKYEDGKEPTGFLLWKSSRSGDNRERDLSQEGARALDLGLGLDRGLSDNLCCDGSRTESSHTSWTSIRINSIIEAKEWLQALQLRLGLWQRSLRARFMRSLWWSFDNWLGRRYRSRRRGKGSLAPAPLLDTSASCESGKGVRTYDCVTCSGSG